MKSGVSEKGNNMSMSVDDVFNSMSPPNEDGAQDFVRRFKVDAKDGYNAVIVREPNTEGVWKDQESVIDYPHDLAIDMANMEVTWANFDGQRDIVGVKLREIMDGTSAPPRQPSKDHSDGVRVYVSGKKLFSEAFRELQTNSYYAKEAFKQLYKKCLEEQDKHVDQVPVIRFDTPTERKTKKGSKVMPPNMSIVGWTKRDAFDGVDDAPATSSSSGKAVFE